jgi:3-oxoadipate enol-lactonase
MASYTDLLFGLMESLSINKAVLAGCSMGGYIVLDALRRDAGRFAGIILSNTRAGSDSDEARENRYRQAEEVLQQGPDELVEAMSGKLVSEQTKQKHPEIQSRLRTIMESATPEGIAGALHAMARRPDSTDILERLTVPVSIITGKDDGIIPPSEAESMHDVIKHSELHVIEGTGHMTALERPDLYNSILSAFIERLA